MIFEVRCLPLAERGEKGTVHDDYTAKCGPRRVRDHLPPSEADEVLRHRFAEINVWHDDPTLAVG